MKARFWRDGLYRASTSDEVGSFANYSETLETVSFPHGVKLQKGLELKPLACRFVIDRSIHL